MISGIASNVQTTLPNAVQEQGNTVRMESDIRTNNAEQLVARNVETMQEDAGASGLKHPDENARRVGEEEERRSPAPPLPGAGEILDEEIVPEYPPPPPSFLELQVQATYEQLKETNQAINEFYLGASITAAYRKTETMEADQAASGPGRPNPVDVKA